MNIFFTLKKQDRSDYIEINSDYILFSNLRTQIADKLKVSPQEIKATNPNTMRDYSLHDYVKAGTNVLVELRSPPPKAPGAFQIVSKEKLEQMCNVAKIFLVKSSNQQNVQIAKQHSVWATTFANQEKLKHAFRCSQHVLLFFSTNRSYEVKGIARMESDPQKTQDKSIWSGVANIRLGGNFMIRWLRKKSLTLSQIQKSLGSYYKEELLRICDGSELEADVAAKISTLFELPTQPYYAAKALAEKQQKKIQLRGILNKSDTYNSNHLASQLTHPQMLFNSTLLIQNYHPPPHVVQPTSKKSEKKDKKKRKKKKSKRKKYSDSSDSSSSNSSSLQDSSSSYKKKIYKKRHRHKKSKHSHKSKHKH